MKRLKHILTATSLVWIAFPVAATDLPKTTHLDASCLVSVWSPSSRAIAEDKYWRPEVNLNRLSFAKPAPSEDGNALAIQAENGIPGEMVSLKRTNGFAKQHAPAIGRIRAISILTQSTRSISPQPNCHWGFGGVSWVPNFVGQGCAPRMSRPASPCV